MMRNTFIIHKKKFAALRMLAHLIPLKAFAKPTETLHMRLEALPLQLLEPL
jgi:hypothetical protein